jgi:hypothetical protein
MSEEVLTDEELKLAIQRIFKLSQTDPAFRAVCLTNPNEAIRLITGKAVPHHTTIQFVDSLQSG